MKRLVRLVAKHRLLCAEFLVKWLNANEKSLPGMNHVGTTVRGEKSCENLALTFVGNLFASLLASVARQVVPETRIYLRKSWMKLPCWRIEVPSQFTMHYLGNMKTVKRWSENPNDIDATQCMDARTIYEFQPVLLELPGGHFEQISSTTQLLPGSFLYTVCSLCLADEKSTCKCKRWIMSSVEVQDLSNYMSREHLELDEFLATDLCANCVLGGPEKAKIWHEGGVNLRQMFNQCLHVAVLSYLLVRKFPLDTT